MFKFISTFIVSCSFAITQRFFLASDKNLRNQAKCFATMKHNICSHMAYIWSKNRNWSDHWKPNLIRHQVSFGLILSNSPGNFHHMCVRRRHCKCCIGNFFYMWKVENSSCQDYRQKHPNLTALNWVLSHDHLLLPLDSLNNFFLGCLTVVFCIPASMWLKSIC